MSANDSSGEPSRLNAGQLIARRYRIDACLGSGGMGSVYRVEDTELKGTLVVLKLLHPELGRDPEMFERFRNEVLLARSLIHPNIGRTFDIGKTENGEYFLTMEYIDGVPLKDLIKRPQPGQKPVISADQLDQAVSVIEQILDGIGHAHEQGVIHRDLKPANVLVTKNGVVKIVDFGTARLITDSNSLTKTGQIIGTPAYMSPEQIEGRSIGRSCDIYAVGMIGFELLAGRPPFAAENYIQIMYKQVHEPFPALGSEASAVPAWYEQAISTAAAKAPEKRFASAAEFKMALRTGSKVSPAKSAEAPSRTGNMLILGLFVCLVLGFGSYLAYLYNPPPPLSGGPSSAKNGQVIEKAEAPPKGPSAENNTADSAANIEQKSAVKSPDEIHSKTEAPLTNAKQSPAVEVKTPPASTIPAVSGVSNLPQQSDIAQKSQKGPETALNTGELLPSAEDKSTATGPGDALFFRLPGLAPADSFFSGDVGSIRWVAEIGQPAEFSGSIKAQLSVSRENETGPVLFRSQGSILQSSPEIKFGGNFSDAPLLAPGKYRAQLEIRRAGTAGSVKGIEAVFSVR